MPKSEVLLFRMLLTPISIRSKMPYVNEPPSRPSLYRTANSASPGASVSAEGTRMSPLAPVSVPARAGDAPKTSSAARAKISDVHCCLFTERFAMTATSLHDSLDPRHRGLRTKKGSLRSEEHTSELQSRENLVCRLLLEK